MKLHFNKIIKEQNSILKEQIKFNITVYLKKIIWRIKDEKLFIYIRKCYRRTS